MVLSVINNRTVHNAEKIITRKFIKTEEKEENVTTQNLNSREKITPCTKPQQTLHDVIVAVIIIHNMND